MADAIRRDWRKRKAGTHTREVNTDMVAIKAQIDAQAAQLAQLQTALAELVTLARAP